MMWIRGLLLALMALLLVPMPAQANRYAAIVVDAETGRILYGRNMDAARFPASLTKMMTLYMTFLALDAGKLRPEQRLPVSKFAAGQSPTKLGLRSGQTIKVQDAILGLVTQSANDASVVLAEAIGGSESRFASLMTRQARHLGMSRTTFRNASGLPQADQQTSARDMATLSRALLYHFPQHYRYFSTASFNYAGIRHDNHNRLMRRYPGMDGIKTGFINASGFNLAASAVRNGRRLIAVVFGGRTAASRDAHMEELLNEQFRRLGTQTDIRTASALPRLPDSTPALIASTPTPARKPEIGQGDTDLPANLASQPVADIVTAASISGWGVQVGAFRDHAASRRAIAAAGEQAPALLGRALPMVSLAETSDGQTLYRARLLGLSEPDAGKVCALLRASDQPCMVLPPAS